MFQEQFTMDDGVSLFLRRWEAPRSEFKSPKAILHIIHGMGEHSERYGELSVRLGKEGIDVWALDQRGHGQSTQLGNPHGSGGLLGHCSDGDGVSRVAEDIHIINNEIKKRHPGIPVFLMGHSWGSFIAQMYIEKFEGKSKWKDGLDLAGCILSGTRGPGGLKIFLAAKLMRFMAFIIGQRKGSELARNMTSGSYNKPFRPNRTEFDWLSRDEKEVDSYIADPFCGFLCSIGFYRDMTGALNKIHKKREMRKIRRELPIYIFSGTSDPVTDMGVSHASLEAVYKHLEIRDLETVLYKDARHETLNETNKEEVMDKLISWLLLHI